ncbi:thioredoxin-like protein CITRX1, chloroplastic [Henckelia pumila]|uniref:thioredoxin-like protein CITRX1, chloroplastic n=1 Tax=Henckelia pumila TaxID=405737 RepID=UPI003C6E854C
MQAAVFSFHTSPPSLPLSTPQFSFNTRPPKTTLFFPPNICNTPSSLTFSRRLLCKPPAGKYISDDYLVKKISSEDLQELVKGERKVPLIIDFYATWCGPCILMAQELEMLAVEYENNALIVKVDTDDEYEFARDMQVRGLPTLYFLSPDPNKDAIRTEGLIPIEMIRDIIDNEL